LAVAVFSEAFLTLEDAPNFGGCHHAYGGKGWPVVQAEPVEEVVRSMNGKDRNGDPGGDPQTDEDRHEKLNRELLELLQELRVAIPGVQVLFAFLLVVPFSQGFASVSTPQRYVYFATMLCTAVSAVLLLAPSSHHRLLWRQDQREERLEMGNHLAVGGMAFLALAMLGAIFLISAVVFGDVMAAGAALGIGLLFAWFWYGQPLRRLRHGSSPKGEQGD
jgi:hypothetical protein